MHSRIYEGHVRHRRERPIVHAFSYRLYWLYLDLAELDEVFRGRWLWSTRGPNVARFRREDHLGDPNVELDESVRLLVANKLGRRPTGPIRLLTQLRMFGFVMNPVSFYYCFEADGETLDAVVAEVHNTPWGERHCYVLDLSNGDRHPRQAKEFHVSPFMPMQQEYVFHVTPPGERLQLGIENHEAGEQLFAASIDLRERPLTARTLAWSLLRYPFVTFGVFAAIYWQALWLWWKGCQYFPHPKGEATPAPPGQT